MHAAASGPGGLGGWMRQWICIYTNKKINRRAPNDKRYPFLHAPRAYVPQSCVNIFGGSETVGRTLVSTRVCDNLRLKYPNKGTHKE